ncbi:MAG: transglutaminase-like cysteine peptidase [Campylobacteraceae bacterium]|nr:transglutaminase-like cysteine peptidase [Campylobacteraceae bacterium]
MKHILILITIFCLFLNAKELKLTKKELNYIKDSPNKSFIINRFKKFKVMRDKIKHFPTEKKLAYVNAFFNKILPIDDATKYNYDDYWATRKEFIIEGRGDCEDYVIAKYFTLLEVGIKKENLYFAVVQVKGKTSYHMNLLYLDKPTSVPLVLDNLSFKVVPFPKRKKLLPKFVFNEFDAHILTKTGLGKKVKIDWGEVNKWEVLLDRVYNKNE